MADKIVSPGLFMNEKDLSFLPVGIGQIGAVIIGPTVKGPAFVPTSVASMNDFIAQFGDTNERVSFVPYAVREYLRSASRVTIIRVLHNGGYTLRNPFVVIASGSFGRKTIAVLAPSRTVSGSLYAEFGSSSALPTGLSLTASFALKLSGSGVTGTQLSASAVPTNPNFLANIYGTSPASSRDGYTLLQFPEAISSLSGSAGAILQFVSSSDSVAFGGYQAASTPWITGPLMPGSSTQRLFKIQSIADGTATNKLFKIAVVNSAKPGTVPGTDYGQFTIIVRDYNDTDQKPNVLELFSGLSLDPGSPNYIARKIGDLYKTSDSTGRVITSGSYPNKSKYIRVNMNGDVDNGSLTPNSYPKGFEALLSPFSSSATVPAVPTASFVTVPQIAGAYNDRAYYGFDFSLDSNLQYCNPNPTDAATDGNVEFNLDNMFAHPSSSTTYGGLSLSGSTIPASYLKYIVPMQGGFDGSDPSAIVKFGKDVTATNLFGFDCSGYQTSGSVAYRKALTAVSNPDEFDINVVVMPGITLESHLTVAQSAIQVCEDRGDCFLIVDPALFGTTKQTLIDSTNIQSLDTNYAATYYPWIRIVDANLNKPVWVPPSVGVAGVYSFNDANSFEWFAPAGLTRGLIKSAVDIESRLSQQDRDDLYERRINPIATVPNQGFAVWGQKNLQALPSALDRVNVRRLLIAVKKFIASATRFLVFENNTTSTRTNFVNIVTPYLATVQQKSGLYAFKVVMDETNNTSALIDENKMYGQIYLQPAKSAEFLIVDFNIMKTGASFTGI